ncbi:helix-turn-helix domain-containing protein [Microbacterium sp. Clip185]|uniref:helix-turn-helix domain-containing protein n=1 Tax=Microbacterium sp. Clip185 TaxID=3025663 RepID=UPI00236740E7|nr:helix-turn-helix transcriptional regulator [Microbacterium sp. Clip185]WDG17482.1 helix-turn-helix transcriptional regulator [Microbacterium sp. Clip185]
MRIEKIVGQNMAKLRAHKDWSQPQLGKAIGDLLGTKPWSRQAVSNAENGQRAFTAADLVAIACVLETSPAALLALGPTSTVKAIEVGDVSIPRGTLENPTWTHETTSEALGEVLNVVRVIATGLDKLQDVAMPLEQAANDLTAAGIMLQGRIRLEEAGAARSGDFGIKGP